MSSLAKTISGSSLSSTARLLSRDQLNGSSIRSTRAQGSAERVLRMRNVSRSRLPFDKQEMQRIGTFGVIPQARDEIAEIASIVAGRDNDSERLGRIARAPADCERNGCAVWRLDDDRPLFAGRYDISPDRRLMRARRALDAG